MPSRIMHLPVKFAPLPTKPMGSVRIICVDAYVFAAKPGSDTVYTDAIANNCMFSTLPLQRVYTIAKALDRLGVLSKAALAAWERKAEEHGKHIDEYLAAKELESTAAAAGIKLTAAQQKKIDAMINRGIGK